MRLSSKKNKQQPVQQQQPRQEQCVALCDYFSAQDDEISFKKGDVITVVTKGNDSGFWSGYVTVTSIAGSRKARGLMGGESLSSPTSAESGNYAPNGNKIGLFPNCMVTSNCRLKSGTSSFINKAAAMYSYEPKDMTEMRFEKFDVLTIISASQHAGWWHAVNETAKKRLEADAAPKSMEASLTIVQAIAGTVDAPLLVPTNFITCDIVVAMFAFQGREKHELSFQAGEVLHVKRKWNDGWWEAILNGQRGIFPSNYTDPNVCTLQPPLFCGHCKTIFATTSRSVFNDCKNCARHEEIVSTMRRSLEMTVQENEKAPEGFEQKVLDLFEFIEMDPKVAGAAALLTPADIIKSAGGGVSKGVAGVASGLGNLHFSHDGAGGPGIGSDEYADARINDEEIFHRRGETRSILAEIEKKRSKKAEEREKEKAAAEEETAADKPKQTYASTGGFRVY